MTADFRSGPELQRLAQRGAARRAEGQADRELAKADAAAERRRRDSVRLVGRASSRVGQIVSGIACVAIVSAASYAIFEHGSPALHRFEELYFAASLLPAALLFGLLQLGLRGYLRRALEQERRWLRDLPFPVVGLEELLAEEYAPDFTLQVVLERAPADPGLILDAARGLARRRDPAPTLSGAVLCLGQTIRTRDLYGGHNDSPTANLSHRRLRKVIEALLLPLHARTPIRSVTIQLR